MMPEINNLIDRFKHFEYNWTDSDRKIESKFYDFID